MPDLWYYGRNEQRHGPVPLEELKGLVVSGNLDATDLVWSPGMADWMAASEVDGLFFEPASTVTSPPPPPPEATSPPPAPSEADVPVAEDRWHYERQGERCGPVSFGELRHLAASGRLQSENLRGNRAWRTGFRRCRSKVSSPGPLRWLPRRRLLPLRPRQKLPW